MDEQATYDRACASCLCECFKVLTIELALGTVGSEDTPAVRFRACRALCLEARALARGDQGAA